MTHTMNSFSIYLNVDLKLRTPSGYFNLFQQQFLQFTTFSIDGFLSPTSTDDVFEIDLQKVL